MNVQKYCALQTYTHDQCVTNRITWPQYISTNYLLQIIHSSFPKIRPPETKDENEFFLFHWVKNNDYLTIGVNKLGQFVWRVYFQSSLNSEGHLGFGKKHHDERGNFIPWPILWMDETKKKYFEYFTE